MQTISNFAGLRKRLASVILMLVLLGSFFIPYGMMLHVSAATLEAKPMHPSVTFKSLKAGETGVVQATNGNWYRVANGKVDWNATGVYQNIHGWWRVKDGQVDFNANSIYQNNNGWWKTTNGKVTFKEEGVFQNELGWWYCKDSKVDFGFTGVASNRFGSWYCRTGKVDFSFNGYGRNKEGNWCIANGEVQKNRNGDLTIGTRLFHIRNGRISWDGSYFLQPDAPYSNITYAGITLATSGCGPVSVVNAIYCLNGVYVPVEEVANWGYNNKYFNADKNGGIAKREFFTNIVDQFGGVGMFRYTGYGKDVQDPALRSHLLNGGTAVLHVNYHFIAIIDYDPETNQYFVLDSYPGSGTSMPSKYRTTTAEGDWVTLDELQKGWLAVTEYWMYSKA